MTEPVRPHRWRPGAEARALGEEPRARSAPPLLLLHGTGGDEDDLLPLADALSPASAVLSPRGTVLEHGMHRFFRRVAEGVFDEDDLARQTDDLADFVAAAGEEHGIEPGAWVAVGFSNGANIASSLLLRRPEILGGAILLAAMVPYREPPPGPALTGKWAVIANGRRDPMADAAQTATLARQLRDRGATVEELPHALGHTIDPAQLPRLAAIIAGGPGALRGG